MVFVSVSLFTTIIWAIWSNIFVKSNDAEKLQKLLNNSLIYDTFDVYAVKGVMKRQNLKISKIKNQRNDWHTCYQVICQGNGCPAENAVVQFCYPAIIITGLPKCGTTALYDLIARYSGAMLMDEKENCPYARRRPHWQFFNSMISLDKVIEKRLIVDGCIQIAPNMIIRQMLRQPNTIYIVMTRNYADMLWSSYNFWCRWDVDGGTCDSSRWATVGKHVRSNTLFHDIINADVNGTLFNKGPDDKVIIKNPTFIVRPCIHGGGYFSEFLTLQLWRFVPRQETLVIASEELESDPWIVWLKVASFFPKIDKNSLQLGNFSKIRFNTQDPNIAKGQNFLLTGVPIDKYRPGRFAISNYQPLLPETRTLLDTCWMDDCILTSQITGYVYDVCKEALLKTIALGKFKSISQIYNETKEDRYDIVTKQNLPVWK